MCQRVWMRMRVWEREQACPHVQCCVKARVSSAVSLGLRQWWLSEDGQRLQCPAPQALQGCER